MAGANDAVEMYKSIMGCSPAVRVEDFHRVKESHNQGKLVYEAFGERLTTYDTIINSSSVEPELLFNRQQQHFAHLISRELQPCLRFAECYDEVSTVNTVAKVWSFLGKCSRSIYLGELTRFMIAEALSGIISDVVVLQYNNTSFLSCADLCDHGAFSIMANKDTYIQVTTFQDDNEQHFIYSRSKVDGVELFFKDVMNSSNGQEAMRNTALKAVDRHFQRFVAGVVELHGGQVSF